MITVIPAFAGTTMMLVVRSRLLQRRGKILDQIVRMLEPGGEANKALADAEFGAGLWRPSWAVLGISWTRRPVRASGCPEREPG